MCGIWGIFGANKKIYKYISDCYKIYHRGPDSFRYEVIQNYPNCALGFHRLSIIDEENGMQPIRVPHLSHIWMIYNGEIYNYIELKNKYNFNFLTKCDGEILIHLYNKGGIEFMCRNLYGIFAFILFDTKLNKIFIGRDTFGVRPLFKMYYNNNVNYINNILAVSSEAKGIINLTNNLLKVEELKPGIIEEYNINYNINYNNSNSDTNNTIDNSTNNDICTNKIKLNKSNNKPIIKYITSYKYNSIGVMPVYDFNIKFNDVFDICNIEDILKSFNNDENDIIVDNLDYYINKNTIKKNRLKKNIELITEDIRNILINAVKMRILENENNINDEICISNDKNIYITSKRKIGCFLSGGLDSSLICGILVNELKKIDPNYQIQTFCIGMDKDSTDIIAAKKVAEFLNTEHHEVFFTEDDAIKAIPEVIRTIESYDITTVRASIGMYLLSKYIKNNTNTVVLFSGEGSDEICQGYIYFHNAPNYKLSYNESLRLCNDLYLYDIRRADRTTSAFGLELRVPFLDHIFSSYYLNINNELKIPLQEYILYHFIKSDYIRQYSDKKVEKFLLRYAFNNLNIIPQEILWRKKEAFSDGVTSKSKSLFQYINEYVDKHISDSHFNSIKYDFNPPKTKEALYYREIFDKFYPKCEHFTPYIWLPKWTGNNNDDPSARTLNNY